MELFEAILRAFAVGGAICVVGQLLFDAADLTPAVSMSVLVSAGALCGACGWYDRLVDFAGFGARLPISSFGNTLLRGALEGYRSSGAIGLLTGMLTPVSLGICAAVLCGFVCALIFRPRA